MTYFLVRWLEAVGSEEFPEWILSEIDDARWETRKLEVYSSGKMVYCDVSVSDDGLGQLP